MYEPEAIDASVVSPLNILKTPGNSESRELSLLMYGSAWTEFQDPQNSGQSECLPRKATAISLTGWRFEPAACDVRRVQVEIILRVSYVLSP